MFLINDKCEEALAAIVAPAVTGVQVLTGKSASDKQAPPVIICSAACDGEADPYGTGNYFVRCSVAIRTNAVADDSSTDSGDELDSIEREAAIKAENQALVESVFAAVQRHDLADLMSEAVAGLLVFPGSVQFEAPESGQGSGGYWIDVLHLRCYGCGQIILPTG